MNHSDNEGVFVCKLAGVFVHKAAQKIDAAWYHRLSSINDFRTEKKHRSEVIRLLFQRKIKLQENLTSERLWIHLEEHQSRRDLLHSFK